MIAVDLFGIQMDPVSGAAVLVLREQEAPNRLLPIVVGGVEAASIAMAAQRQATPRPMTHDLMATLVERFDAHLDAVEVVGFEAGTFVANLAVSGPTGDLRLDTRPSDAIALAVRLHAPLYVSDHVLDAAGVHPGPDGDVVLDDAQIDDEVDQFRDFLDGLDPDDFAVGVTQAPDVVEVDPGEDVVDAEIVEDPDV